MHSQILLLKKVAWHGDSFIFNSFLEAFYLNQITCIRFLKALHSKTRLQSTPPVTETNSALREAKFKRALRVHFLTHLQKTFAAF